MKQDFEIQEEIRRMKGNKETARKNKNNPAENWIYGYFNESKGGI